MAESTRLLNRLIAFLLASTVICSIAAAQSPQDAATGGACPPAEWPEHFAKPPDTVKPWAYWWWLKGNVSESSITRDLEAMKRVGIAGLLMFDARGYHEGHVPPPESRMEFMSPEWRRMVKFAMSEADRLGIEMSINLSSCAGALKGPWLVGADAPKKLIWTSAQVAGPARLKGKLPRGDGEFFWDVAVLAARHRAPADGDQPAGSAERADAFNLSGDWRDVAARFDPKMDIDQVIDLTDQVDAAGGLSWEVPAGRWTVVRFACVTMEGHEYDVDVLDPEAVTGHFNRMGRALLDDAGPLAGKTLTHFYSVSWEGAAPTWTLDFEQQFVKYRGYEPRGFLPVLAGMTVTSAEASERFARDYHKTLGDAFRDNFYGTLRELCGREGIKWHSESGGPWNRSIPDFQHADQLAFLSRNDMPQGEFWHLGRALNRPPAMTAHTYGKPRAATEAFTHMRTHWSAYPAVLKPDADAAFCDGINHFIWHTFSASPPEFGKPGIEYFAGTHVNPNVTWFDQAGDFFTYLARCQFLLRQGQFVADVCCYVGDKPYLHWGRGEQWTAKPTMVLGKGYAYDLINTEVLLSGLAVDNGHLVLPHGMRYRVLAVDLEDESVSPEALEKILELAQSGATVVLGQRRPERTPGLQDFPACDQRVGRLAAQLWGAETQPNRRSLGKGVVFRDTAIDEALAAEGIAPDFEGPSNYIHRRTDDAEVYFLTGSGLAECTFRTGGRAPEFWDPQTGTIRDAIWYRASDDGRTAVTIDLPENGAVFVVFRQQETQPHLVGASGPEGGMELDGRGPDGARLRLWQEGRYRLTTSETEEVAIDVAGLPKPQTVAGPWAVRFTPGWGAPETMVFDQLIPWNEHSDEGLRYYSGTADYRTTFDLDESQTRGLVRLALGRVGNIAEVRVNGCDARVVWTAPWTVDLTGIAKAGQNELEVRVANLWVNRLIGDAALPPEKRFTKTNVGFFPAGEKIRPFQGFVAGSPLEPSGLIGPVQLEFGVQRLVSQCAVRER